MALLLDTFSKDFVNQLEIHKKKHRRCTYSRLPCRCFCCVATGLPTKEATSTTTVARSFIQFVFTNRMLYNSFISLNNVGNSNQKRLQGPF